MNRKVGMIYVRQNCKLYNGQYVPINYQAFPRSYIESIPYTVVTVFMYKQIGHYSKFEWRDSNEKDGFNRMTYFLFRSRKLFSYLLWKIKLIF